MGSLKTIRRLEVTSPVPADIDIANSVEPLHVSEIAEDLGLSSKHYDLYGKYKAKVNCNKTHVSVFHVRGFNGVGADLGAFCFRCFYRFWMSSKGLKMGTMWLLVGSLRRRWGKGRARLLLGCAKLWGLFLIKR